jgi:hypothetical protein
MGLDFAWWGSGGDARSQADTLFFATVHGDQAGPLGMRRVDLSATYDPCAPDVAPNCDADAALVVRAAAEIAAAHPGGPVVMAVDAPLRALERPHLAPRNRKVAGGTERRQCERAATEGQKGDGGRNGWKSVWNVQAGAPICPRVAALVAGLQSLGFDLYDSPDRPPGKRVLFECFPGEALWSLGARGHFGDGFAGEAKEYKAEQFADPRLWGQPAAEGWRPWPEVMNWVNRGLYGFGVKEILGAPQQGFHRWMTDLAGYVLADKNITDAAGRQARRGKPLDDLVESMNCFLTAVAFARGRAHVWLGDDPRDGHIIGPGL